MACCDDGQAIRRPGLLQLQRRCRVGSEPDVAGITSKDHRHGFAVHWADHIIRSGGQEGEEQAPAGLALAGAGPGRQMPAKTNDSRSSFRPNQCGIFGALVQAAASRAQPGENPLHIDSRNRPAVAQASAAGQGNPAVAAEIDRFEQAARQRLGEENVAAAFRAGWDGRVVSVPGAAAGHLLALQETVRSLTAVQRGRGDHEVQRNLEAFRERERRQEWLGQSRGLVLGR